MTKEPLIPSLLYTEGSVNVKQEVEKDLAVPDPSPEEAEKAVANACSNFTIGVDPASLGSIK